MAPEPGSGGVPNPSTIQSEDSRAQLLLQQLTYPATLGSVEIVGAKHTRRSFLDPVFAPLLASSHNADTTLGDVLSGLRGAVDKLHRFDIFNPAATTLHLAPADPTDPLSTPTDLLASLTFAEKPRLFLKTGTSVGNSEASGYTTLHLRNLFGGGESLSLNATAGTRTRGAYGAVLTTPLFSDPGVSLSLEADSATQSKAWASHDEGVARLGAKISFGGGPPPAPGSPAAALPGNGALPTDKHTLALTTSWRQVSGLLPAASATVRRDAGDSVKTSLAHSWVRDGRDSAVLPHEGVMLRASTELAGWGPLGRGSDVAFVRGEWEAQGAVPLPFVGSLVSWLGLGGKGASALSKMEMPTGAALNAGLRFGALYPLPLGGYDAFSPGSYARPSRITDRFTLGGPNDVRGFALGGLGPRDGSDAVGGDVFAAGSASVVLPLTPSLGRDSPLRLQIFANAGRLAAMPAPKGKEKAAADGPEDGTLDGRQVWQGMSAAVRDLANGWPSMAAGVGIVYAHPVARFELNFSLPLVLRRGEEGIKGLQLGVGVSYL